MSTSESAEPSGWLRLGDLNGGVCVTSLIKDKIREYMLNEEQHQQTTATSTTTTTAVATPSPTSKNGDVTCVRRIGNSLDLLLRESRNASHAVAAAKNKPSSLSSSSSSSPSPPSFAVAATTVTDMAFAAAYTVIPIDHIEPTAVITAPADSSRPTIDRPLPPLPPLFTKR